MIFLLFRLANLKNKKYYVLIWIARSKIKTRNPVCASDPVVRYGTIGVEFGSTSKYFLQFSKNKFSMPNPVMAIFQGGVIRRFITDLGG